MWPSSATRAEAPRWGGRAETLLLASLSVLQGPLPPRSRLVGTSTLWSGKLLSPPTTLPDAGQDGVWRLMSPSCGQRYREPESLDWNFSNYT